MQDKRCGMQHKKRRVIMNWGIVGFFVSLVFKLGF